MRVVIDTNVLVSSLSSKSAYHWLIQQLLLEKIEVLISDEILLEYEEILTQKYSMNVAQNFITSLKELPNVHFTRIYYRWNLLNDEDDNKFVDCAIAGNANYIITNDKDFNILKQVNFPKVNIIKIDEFEVVIKQSPESRNTQA
jgi:putative PIN family toxin of toxin-antitoxin system